MSQQYVLKLGPLSKKWVPKIAHIVDKNILSRLLCFSQSVGEGRSFTYKSGFKNTIEIHVNYTF